MAAALLRNWAFGGNILKQMLSQLSERTHRIRPDSLRSIPLAPRRKVRTQNELAFEATRFETAMGLRDLIERDALRDARVDGAARQHIEQPPKVLHEPGRMSCPHCIN